LLNHGFTPRAVRQLRTLIEQTVHDLLERVSGRGDMDLIADFAYPLPAIVLADVYSIPRSDAELLKKWSDDMKVFIGGSPDLSAKAHAAAAGLEEMMHYFAAAVAQRRRAPRPDLITVLLRAEEEGDFLSEQELCSNLVLVLAASYVTSMDMIGNGVFALLQQGSQWRRLQASRDQVPSAIDEILRYDGPVQLTHRLATEDIPMHGKMIAKGDLVYLMRGAANRDPDRFPEPDTVRVDRRDTGHVAFGAGVHYCLGAGLVRMEGAAALHALLDRMPDLALAQGAQVRYRADSLQFRGLSALPVTFTPHPPKSRDDRH
jgi:cytochrome P450